jgi:hypothetical protein
MRIQQKKPKPSIQVYKMLIHTPRNAAETMTNVPDAFRLFLDIEAQVGDGEDDEEYGDGQGPGELIPVISMSAR